MKKGAKAFFNSLGMKVESLWDEGFKDFWILERVGSLNSLSALFL